ncbi:MAG: hypothetical protein A2V66_00115 [Ignavibacteria bacterium RBG_13_36_8]|nr:MAG: hypothetical protein A2V66_00115 [Ignavibacteria bacterium RBG_13_36_8]
MGTRKKIFLLFLFIINYSILGYVFPINSQQEKPSSKEARNILLKIEEGINSGRVDLFSNFFGEKTYLSLVNGHTGYFSSSQAYYVLKDFLTIYKPYNFKLTSIVANTTNPFASGILRYSIKGIRGNAMVFISLKYLDDRWIITQITIN